MDPKTFIFFGPPGAGKSTQAKWLAEHIKQKTGENVVPLFWSVLRDSFMQENVAAQDRFQQNHSAGKIQPKFFSISIWGHELLKKLGKKEHLIIDGIPRQPFEAEALDSAFHFFDRHSIVVLNMVISNEMAFERIQSRAISEGRVDDQHESSARRRLAWFESESMPILEKYRLDSRYIVTDIKADQDRSSIEKELKSIVN